MVQFYKDFNEDSITWNKLLQDTPSTINTPHYYPNTANEWRWNYNPEEEEENEKEMSVKIPYNSKWIVEKNLFLNDFTIEVTNNNYKKIPYSDWRKMSKSYFPWLLITTDGIGRFSIKEADWIKNNDILCVITNDTLYEGIMHEENDDTFNHYILKVWGNFVPYLIDLDDRPLCQILDDSVHYLINNFDHNAIYEKENNNNMNTDKLFNFDFGPVSNSKFRLSPYGIAVATANNGWVSYNEKTQEIFNVEILNFDISKLIYKMPVAQNEIKPGDLLIHCNKPVFVRSINDNGTVSVIDYVNASVTDILPVKSPFGFNFFTKVCALMDLNKVNADADNPFGNILPFLMLSNDNQDFDPMIFLFMNNNNSNFTQNPMMLYFLMNQKGNNDNILPLLMMANGNNLFGAPAPKGDQ